MTIFFDMDGTIANLYGITNWLEKLQKNNPSPYEEAKVMLNMSLLARYLNKIKRAGYSIGIISWLSKQSTPEYDEAVTAAKIKWLNNHLPSVKWDIIHIVKYNTPKQQYKKNKLDILFDDELKNRINWGHNSYKPEQIISVLKKIAIKVKTT